jgi:hypothetical protein
MPPFEGSCAVMSVSNSRSSSATATWICAVARSWAVNSSGVARIVQPFDDLGGVEANKVADFEIEHTALSDKATDVAH